MVQKDYDIALDRKDSVMMLHCIAQMLDSIDITLQTICVKMLTEIDLDVLGQVVTSAVKREYGRD